MATIGFIGLGVMGYPMAGHLAGAGHEVTVYNRTEAKAEAWVGAYGGGRAATPREAAQGAELVMTIVGNDDDVRAVVLGDDGVLAGLEGSAVLVDHTTASADLARDLHQRCKADGIGFVDAPVSGGQSGAENGALTVMCGGDQNDFDRMAPVADAYAVAVTRLGPAGSGQLTKMVNQLCIAGLVQGLSEGIHLGMKAGLDIDLVVDVISKGAAGSWQMANRGSSMGRNEFDFGFAVDWMRKDLGIALDEADRLGARLPVGALVDQLYAQVQARGGARWDTSSLIDLLTNP
ncbi:MAG: NAD(P)-dependent oxidoreductase [Actinomycetia bacterium]|nr:NAD(P)-dependent oxidoreductase [Actinomycetes bacterium]MCP4228273.1 NAD(P)-dependent oxidoreductase [Actinomycetes bacterium]MCP5031178.1 NAD(P)-dependent oxidoreductase [Actinomycetes bacterium]